MTLINYFDLRPEALVSQRVTFQEIFSKYELNKKDEENFRKSVKSIFLKAIISERTSGIRHLKNEEYDVRNIQIFEVNLYSKSNIRHIETTLHSIFPNHIIIIFLYQNEYRLSFAQKRLSKLEANKTVLEKEANTHFFQNDTLMKEYNKKLSVYKDNVKNQMDLYINLMNYAYYQRTIKYINRLPNINPDLNISLLLEQIILLKDELSYYKNKKEKGRQLAQRMTAHQELIETNRKLNKILQILKEEL